VRVGTAAVAVGSVACTGVIAVGLAAQSGALSAEADQSVIVPDTGVSQVVSIRSVVGKDKAKKVKKPAALPKPAPTPPAPAPSPSNNGGGGNNNGGGGKSHGS